MGLPPLHALLPNAELLLPNGSPHATGISQLSATQVELLGIEMINERR